MVRIPRIPAHNATTISSRTRIFEDLNPAPPMGGSRALPLSVVSDTDPAGHCAEHRIPAPQPCGGAPLVIDRNQGIVKKPTKMMAGARDSARAKTPQALGSAAGKRRRRSLLRSADGRAVGGTIHLTAPGACCMSAYLN